MSEWVPVAEGPGEKAVEIETEEDGMLLVSAVAAHFPGTTTLKYNGPTGSERAVKLTDDQKLKAPSTGWQTAQCYYTVNPVKEAQKKKEQIELQMKRKAEVQMQLAGGGVEPASKSARLASRIIPSFYSSHQHIGGIKLVLLVNMVEAVALVARMT